MFSPANRRDFLTGSLGLGFLATLPPTDAAAPSVTDAVRLRPDVEPLVRLLEETPRESLLEKVADRIHSGTSYQQLLAATFLAGVRNVQPRPVGFKFHAVLVIHSAHQAAQAAADRDRWLPLFWAMDYFKDAQAQNKKAGGWTMRAADDSKLPSADNARKAFTEAMKNWDEPAADRAVTALARSDGASDIVELFWRFGARDFRDIGHKAIYVANGWRTIQTIGWRHAEPFLRSLAYALLDHEGGNPARRDAEADRPGRDNLPMAENLAKLPPGGKRSSEATLELLQTIREATHQEAGKKVAALMSRGIHPESLWDALFLAAGELLARQPGIVGLHCVTSVNALHFGYQTSGNETTRRFLTLQAASFLTLFREAMKSRGKMNALNIDTLEPEEFRGGVEDIFAEKDRTRAARKTLDLLDKNPSAVEPLMAAARRLVFAKGNNSHDYKFSSAALEDYFHVSPAWRARYAATALFQLRGSHEPDNALITRVRGTLAKG